ncbi:MAG: 2-oxoacid:acceptor oxidoreductase subunit alpha [Verrucomicrobia bacterium]|nr:2-oxoacid:acceptor oxidoreductase subunit alpha [Verrucomicrobiota bacterium]
MSDSISTAPKAGGQTNNSNISEAVIRIAGNSQDGIQSIGGFLARLAGRSEQEVMTFMTIPSTISGGPSIFQVRIGTGEVLSAGDDADVLLAFYQHSYEGHIASLKHQGIVLYDSDHVTPKEEWQQEYHHVGIPISNLTIEAIGGTARDKGKNIFALGLICRIFNLGEEKLKGLITEKFKGKNPKITETALNAFNAGHQYEVGDLIQTFAFTESTKRQSTQVVMNGNEALAYGLIAAGVRFGAGYPITPWSDIMELLRRELPKYGGSFIQCEDEIASISMALGASYAGRVAITGSSGPGISLKTEALGWGIMAEVPLVVVDVQRGGPSTGMPTNVEQSDLNIACFGSHGDAPRVVLAPANVEDAFYTAMEAVQIAKDYSTPVVILTDQAIATRIEAFEEPNLKEICRDIAPDLSPIEDHKPYDLSKENGINPHVAPGTPIKSGKYPVITGLEHDELGHPTGSPKLHKEMTGKRRRKLQALAETIEQPKVYGSEKGDILLVGWGSTQGPIREAVDRVKKEGENWASLHIRHINPLPNGLENIFAKYKHVFVVEINDEGLYGYGQLAGLLRARYCDPKIKGINKTDGLTYKIKEIIQRVRESIA